MNAPRFRFAGLLVVAIMASAILAACGTTGQAAQFLDTEWELDGLNGQDALNGVLVSMKFGEDGKLTGNGGCNRFMGSWDHTGSRELSLSAGGSTMMACDETIMKQEQAFFQALEQTARYKLDRDELDLYDANGRELAELDRVRPTEMTRTNWEVLAFNNGQEAVVSVDGTTMSMVFDPDGTVSGNSGCNTFVGNYKRGTDTLEFGDLAQTAMACDDGIMKQEQAFLAALKQSKTYELGKGTLDLRGEDGALMVMLREAN